MIVIDEIHLLTDFGRSFWAEINMLKEELFSKVRDTKPMLFLTATCTKSVRPSVENLIGVKCNSLYWPSPSRNDELKSTDRGCVHTIMVLFCAEDNRLLSS